jgi:drug/metabolite transporter (DMT)-like permease
MTKKLVQLIDFLRDRLPAVVRICLGLLALLIVLDAIPAVVHKEHTHTWLERLPGFWSIFGLVGCVVLIIASKAFGHAGIMTREDYYDE